MVNFGNSYSICAESSNNIGCKRGQKLNAPKIFSINLFPSRRILDLRDKNDETNIIFMISFHFLHFLPSTPGQHKVFSTGRREKEFASPLLVPSYLKALC
jgi:hypothetical protein